MFPRGLILAIALGVIAGPLFGIFLYEFGIEEQLVYVDGTSLSVVTEKTDFKLGEPITIKIVNSGTDELGFPDTSYGLVIKQLDSINQSVVGTSQNKKLSDDLTLKSIGN